VNAIHFFDECLTHYQHWELETNNISNKEFNCKDVIPIKKGDDVEGRFYQKQYIISILLKLVFPY
jgi:hypothetical protein